MKYYEKLKAYIDRYGIKNLLYKVVEKSTAGYDCYLDAEPLTEEELDRQRRHRFENAVEISIVVPVFEPSPKAFMQTLNSVKEQTYENWQLCIVDAGKQKRRAAVKKVFGDDIRVSYLEIDNKGISENTNAAIEITTGEYVGFLDHDDILEPDALYQMMLKIEQGFELIYSDEDKVNEGLDYYFSPYYKPDYNFNLLLSNNYICHFTVMKKSLILKAGLLRPEYDGAQDYDLLLRAIEYTGKIGHIPRILYHWRAGNNSTSDNPFNKKYAFDAGKRAIEDYLKRNYHKGVKVSETDDPGYYRLICTSKGRLTVTSVVDGIIPDDKENEVPDYYLLLDSDMKISDSDIDKLLKRAYFTGADIIVPKITSKGRYLYNGIARTGNGHTPFLQGKKEWFRGPFNLAVTNMDVHVAPSKGILIRKSLYEPDIFSKSFHINSMKGKFKGIKMVYAPEALITKQR